MREKKKSGLEPVIFEIYGDKGEVMKVNREQLFEYMVKKRKGLFYVEQVDRGIFFNVPYSVN